MMGKLWLSNKRLNAVDMCLRLFDHAGDYHDNIFNRQSHSF